MAQKLESVRDFRRVAKAFNDPNAKPHRWRVKDFGYCSGECRSVTEYVPFPRHLGDGTWSSDEIMCCGCQVAFIVHNRERYKFFKKLDSDCTGRYFLDPEDPCVPKMAKKKIAKLMSREVQEKYLFEALQIAMSKIEHERKSAVQRLARINREVKRLADIEDLATP